MLVWVCLGALGGCGANRAASGGADGGMAATASCADPATACGDSCVDLRDDPANCGACGNACAAVNVEHALCLEGSCSYDSCATGFADCDGDVTNGCEQATSSDIANCGGCGIVCKPEDAAAATCTNGVCGFTRCAAGFGDCDGDASNGCETNLGNDNANCGKCGNVCGGGTVCGGGVCGLVCTGALTLCGTGAGAYCTLTDDDPDNCGSCGHVCTPQHVDNKACAQGQCGYHQCATNYGDCDGDPANGCETCLTCTLTNCGGCGIDCVAVHTTDLACSNGGACVWTSCATGWADCDNSTANGCETADSDTTCGTSCANCTTQGLHCVAGRCG